MDMRLEGDNRTRDSLRKDCAYPTEFHHSSWVDRRASQEKKKIGVESWKGPVCESIAWHYHRTCQESNVFMSPCYRDMWSTHHTWWRVNYPNMPLSSDVTSKYRKRPQTDQLRRWITTRLQCDYMIPCLTCKEANTIAQGNTGEPTGTIPSRMRNPLWRLDTEHPHRLGNWELILKCLISTRGFR